MPANPGFVSTSDVIAPARVYCFPPAGGDPTAFLAWQPALGPDAEIVGVCAPGRAHRADERAAASIDELADGAAAAIGGQADRAVYLFGHSLGALVAFEVARRLSDNSAARHLIASGCEAPRLNPSEYIVWSDGNHGRVFAREAARFMGLSEAFLAADDEVQELLLADLRADVSLLAAYRYRPAPRLGMGITLVCGRDDPHVGPSGLTAWQEECAIPCQYHWQDGDHFYLDRRPEAVTDVIRVVVTGTRLPTADLHVEVI
jgi:surfactin synthase thioesterase subunit